MEFLQNIFWDNTLRQWGVALVFCIAVVVGLRLLLSVLVSRLGAFTRRTRTPVDDLILNCLGRTHFLSLLVFGLYAASFPLNLPEQVRQILNGIAIIVLMIQLGIWAVAAVSGWLLHYRDQQLETDRAAATTVGAVSFLAKLAIWSAVLLIALDNLGVDITAMVTGMGIGGIAVALAVQNILGDLFASLSIVLDKPFVLGDFLILGEHMGSVENVGLKTTRLRSLSGEQLIFSNSDLLSSRIRNYGRMNERRALFSIGVTYQTPREKLKLIPAIVRAAVEDQEKTRFARCHFRKYGDSALEFETVYFMTNPDHDLYLDVQQAVNYRIGEQFEKEGIEFAYPTQTLFLRREAEG